MRQLMRGLYEGAPGMPKAPGIAEIGIHFRHQNLPTVNRYRLDMKRWLADNGFWSDADRYLRWIAVESYPDSRLWAPVGSSLLARERHLQAYLFHLLELVRSGPSTVRTARSFFERKFLPLANSGWRARGGEHFDFVTGHGNTILGDVQMRHFVSEQVYAIRRYAGRARPSRAGRAPRVLVAAVQQVDRGRAGMPRGRSGFPPVPRPDRLSARRGGPRLRRGDLSPGRLPTARQRDDLV